ncbi:hypothetical protein D9613_004658 [Agrocybe pediades]|uniref:Uncharacterized protein n=1 Tax=Agrocybe pediades TaxID=84607 RepID=A0A8H4QZ55_9AGAR|nr:hypothetical protein D9613_004658 [Agrocybe pediades]
MLFVLAMSQVGLQWYCTYWTFVIMGSTRESIAGATRTYPSPKTHLLGNVTYFGPFILADWLMLWRCFHVWGRSFRVIAFPSFLLLSEIVIYIAMIILIGVNIHNVTPAKARVFNSIHIALIVIPVFVSLTCTYLIAHRIYSSSRKVAGGAMMRNQNLKRIIEITVQSSAIYSLILTVTVAVSAPTPTIVRSASMYEAYTYFSAILGPITGIIPTLMVGRVTMLSSRPDSLEQHHSSLFLSEIAFREHDISLGEGGQSTREDGKMI